MWFNKTDRIQCLYCIVGVFCGVSEYDTLFVEYTDVMFNANMFHNQKWSIIFAHVLIIAESKINMFGGTSMDWRNKTFSVI